MHRAGRYFLIIIGIFLFFPLSLFAENLGEFRVDEVVVRPEFISQEGGRGHFRLTNSSLGVRWEKEPNLSSVIRLGSQENLGVSRIFLDESDVVKDLGFYEAYGQYQGPYGTFRAGLIPTGFGINGRLELGDLELPRPLFLSQRWVALRDYGISYEIEHKHFFTTATAHNGEGDQTNSDQETWYTASWGWRNDDRFIFMISGQTGGTNADSTGFATDSDLGQFDETQSARWRFGVAALKWRDGKFKTTLEYVHGERDQNKETEKFYSGYWDMSWRWSDSFATWLRFDALDPSRTLTGDITNEYSLAISIHSDNDNSNFYVIGTKATKETAGDGADDRLTFVWVLRPRI